MLVICVVFYPCMCQSVSAWFTTLCCKWTDDLSCYSGSSFEKVVLIFTFFTLCLHFYPNEIKSACFFWSSHTFFSSELYSQGYVRIPVLGICFHMFITSWNSPLRLTVSMLELSLDTTRSLVFKLVKDPLVSQLLLIQLWINSKFCDHPYWKADLSVGEEGENKSK